MASTIPVRVRQTLNAPLPDYAVGPASTRHSAIGHKQVRANMQFWDTFERDARAWFEQFHRTRHIISYQSRHGPGPANISRQHFLCGEEAGIRGVFQNNVGNVISAVFAATNNNLRVGDYRAARYRMPGRKQPDMAIIDNNGHVRVLGEIKGPWVEDHSLRNAYGAFRAGREVWLRRVLAQIAIYLKAGDIKYGWVSTYEDTILVKQEEVRGEWHIFYTRPISSIYGPANEATVLQSIAYVADQSLQGHRAINTLPAGQWVR